MVVLGNAQVFTGAVGVIRNDSSITTFAAMVTGLNTLTPTNGIIRVKIDIAHPAVQELHIYLRNPTGYTIALSATNGFGANYSNTVFENTATVPISSASAPFSGTYIPDNSLAVFNSNNYTGNGNWTLNILDELKNNNSGTLQSFSLEFGPNPAQVKPFAQSNIPVFVVNTNGKALPTLIDIKCQMYILNSATGSNILSDTSAIKAMTVGMHIRGNSSAAGLKDPYSFSPLDIFGEDSNVSILGMPSENDWILNNAYSDQSFMRDPLSYYLSNRIGRYASRTRFCELVINGEYRGLYCLMEKIKQDKNRIDISSLKTTDTSGADVTGGYIIKKDGSPGVKDSGFYNSASGFYYLYHDPDSPVIQQKRYIKAFMDTAVNALLNFPPLDTLNGYRNYVDYKSAIDYFILSELGVSGDTYNRSTYWHKQKITKGNKLFFGPIWDFNYGWNSPITPIKLTSFNPWKKMYDDTFFKREFWCRYNSLRATVLNPKTINFALDSFIAPIHDAIFRNDERWPQLRPGAAMISGCYCKDACYTLKKYAAERLYYMDSFIRGGCLFGNSCPPIFQYSVNYMCASDSAEIIVNSTSNNIAMSPMTGVRKVSKYKFMVSAKSTLTYFLKWNDCNTGDSVLVNIVGGSPPVVVCMGADTVYSGDSILLVMQGASRYTWSPSVSFFNTVGDSVYVKPTANTTYTITGFTSIGCFASVTKKIVVMPKHPVTLKASADSLCLGEPLKLSATGAESYIWDVNNLLYIADSITIYPTVNLVIKLTGLLAGSPCDFMVKTITVFPKATLTVTPSAPVYFSAPIMVIVKGGVSYQWTPNQGLNRYDNDTVFASPTGSILYTIRAIDSHGCNTDTTVMVTSKTGILNHQIKEDVLISPNPIADNLALTNSTGEPQHILIYNALGEALFDCTIAVGKTTFSVSEWATGIYVIKTAKGIYRIVKP